MWLLRLIVGVLLLVLCVLAFRNQAIKLKNRALYYSSLITMLSALTSELEYLKRSIKEVVNLEYESQHFAKTVYSFYFGNKKAYFPPFLTQNEIVKLEFTLNSLGKSDSASQKLMINSSVKEFQKYYDDLDSVYKKNYGVYVKVGFLLGIILLIMVI